MTMEPRPIPFLPFDRNHYHAFCPLWLELFVQDNAFCDLLCICAHECCQLK